VFFIFQVVFGNRLDDFLWIFKIKMLDSHLLSKHNFLKLLFVCFFLNSLHCYWAQVNRTLHVFMGVWDRSVVLIKVQFDQFFLSYSAKFKFKFLLLYIFVSIFFFAEFVSCLKRSIEVQNEGRSKKIPRKILTVRSTRFPFCAHK
jgi:hypothetical protein